LLDEFDAAVRGRVAAVHEAVDKTRRRVLARHSQQRKKMLHVRVHATIAQQAEKMQIACAAAPHRLDQQRLLKKILRSRSSGRCA